MGREEDDMQSLQLHGYSDLRLLSHQDSHDSFWCFFHLCHVSVNHQHQCISAEDRVKVNCEVGHIKLTKAYVLKLIFVQKVYWRCKTTSGISFLTRIPITPHMDQYKSALFHTSKGCKGQTIISPQPSIWINDLMWKALWQALIVSTLLLLVHRTVRHWWWLILSITAQGPHFSLRADPVSHW